MTEARVDASSACTFVKGICAFLLKESKHKRSGFVNLLSIRVVKRSYELWGQSNFLFF